MLCCVAIRTAKKKRIEAFWMLAMRCACCCLFCCVCAHPIFICSPQKSTVRFSASACFSATCWFLTPTVCFCVCSLCHHCSFVHRVVLCRFMSLFVGFCSLCLSSQSALSAARSTSILTSLIDFHPNACFSTSLRARLFFFSLTCVASTSTSCYCCSALSSALMSFAAISSPSSSWWIRFSRRSINCSVLSFGNFIDYLRNLNALTITISFGHR